MKVTLLQILNSREVLSKLNQIEQGKFAIKFSPIVRVIDTLLDDFNKAKDRYLNAHSPDGSGNIDKEEYPVKFEQYSQFVNEMLQEKFEPTWEPLPLKVFEKSNIELNGDELRALQNIGVVEDSEMYSPIKLKAFEQVTNEENEVDGS